MCSWPEPEELSGDAFVARAADLRVAERNAQPEQLSDRNHESEVMRTGAGPDWHGDIDAVSGAAARWKCCAQPGSNRCLPAGIDAVGRITRPHAADVEEKCVTDVE